MVAMLSVFSLLVISTVQAGFQGASIQLVYELDEDVPSMALDLDLQPWGERSQDSEKTWAATSLSWHFLENESSNEHPVDRLETSILRGQKTFEGGLLEGRWGLGGFVWDDDDGILDFTPAGGRLGFDLLGDLVQGEIGLDVRARWLLDVTERSLDASLGVPLGVSASTPEDRPPFAYLGLRVRPGIGFLGPAKPFQVDTSLSGGVGYAVVRGEEIDLLLALDYSLNHASLTSRGQSVVHTFSAGVKSRF